MKTMKYIFLIVCVACTSITMAVDYKLHQTSVATFKSTSTFMYYSPIGSSELVSTSKKDGRGATANVPAVNFRSTSTMPSTGSSLSTVMPGVVIEESEGTVQPGPKRARPEDNKDPYEDPLGDAVIPLLILAAGYVIYIARRKKAPEAIMK